MSTTRPSRRKRYLTPAEVAEIVNVNPATVRGWARYGYGPRAVKIGGRYRYSIIEVDNWLAEVEDRSVD